MVALVAVTFVLAVRQMSGAARGSTLAVADAMAAAVALEAAN
jgi:hypothetical protein